MKILKQSYLLLFVLLLLLNSCGLPKEVMQRITQQKKDTIDFPLGYCISLPTPTFEQWDKDFYKYDKFLTDNIMSTQLGLGKSDSISHEWWCSPSARPHAQLDTTTMINEIKSIVGEWRVICNRQITFIDSASHIEKKIFRSSKVNFTNNSDDLYLKLTDWRFKFYKIANGKAKSIVNRDYVIENKRYILIYNFLKSNAATSFIGIDKDDRLIFCTFSVQERIKYKFYSVYIANMNQMIFKRMK
jgi:hypothetical protein